MPRAASVGTSDGIGESDPTLETVLAPLHDVEVQARVEGPIVALDVEEGAHVGAGVRLALIDDREPRAALAELEAQAQKQQSALDRARQLHDQKIISEEEWITARSNDEAAKAQRDRAAAELDRCVVRSPFAGVVAQCRIQPGQSVKPGDVLFRISDPDTLRAELLLPEARLGSVRAGQPLRLILAARGEPVSAHVTRVSQLVDPASGTFRVIIDLDNRAGRIPAGITARVEFESAQTARR